MEEKEKNQPELPLGQQPEPAGLPKPDADAGATGQAEAGATGQAEAGATEQAFQAPPVHEYRPPQVAEFRTPPLGQPPVPGQAPTPGPQPFHPHSPYSPNEPPRSFQPQAEPPRPVYPPPPQPERRRSLVGPLILIVIGLVFLLNNMGLMTWSVWEVLWRFWPVWLIAIGVDMLLGRRGRWGGLLALAVVVTMLGGAFYYAGLFTGREHIAWRVGEPKPLNYPLNGAREARVEIESGISRLTLRGGAAADALIQGQITPLDGEQLVDNFSKSGSTAHYTLRGEMRGINLPVNAGRGQGQWDLRLNDQIPMALSLKTGVGQSEVDLSRMMITDLRITSGVGEMTVTLPARGEVRGEIRAGVGQTTIRIPSSMAARIRVQNGLGGVSVRGDFEREGSYYTTPDYNAASQRIDLTVEGGVGGIRIESVR